MEEQILKVIQKSIYFSKENVAVNGPLINTAKEIDTLTKTHYLKFAEWIIIQGSSIKPIVGTDLVYYDWNDSAIKKYTTEELYNYWLNEINKK